MNTEVRADAGAEVGRAGYFIATQVCAMLESRPKALEECLRALNESQEGQSCLARGDSKAAVKSLRGAHARFESIPEARLLLGIIKGDLAAAYANLRAFDKAIGYAEDCLAIVAGVQRLSFSEAMARMTLANSFGLKGKRDQSEREYRIAETILRGLPGTARYLQALESNRKQVLGLATAPNTHRLGKNFTPIIVLGAIVLAALIVFLMWKSS